MGIEGIALATGVILLVLVVVPAFYRGRTVAAQAPADERFAPDLRMIPVRGYAQECHSECQCTIYPSERIMESKARSSQSQAARQQDSRVRTLARARSHAKARMAARRALRTRFGIGAAVLAAVTITLWVLVSSIKLTIAAPIISSVILAAFLAGFVYLARIWAAGDREDNEIISDAEAALEHLRPRRVARRSSAKPSSLRDNTNKARSSQRAKRMSESGRVAAQENPHKLVTEKSAAAEKTLLAESALPAERAMPAEKTAAEKQSAEKLAAQKQTKQPERKIIVPSYTIKPPAGAASKARSAGMLSKLSDPDPTSVTAYEQAQPEEAPVPYRPKQKGERIADVAPEVPHTAPGAEEVAAQSAASCEERRDVLGGGATLDSLLERRRA